MTCKKPYMFFSVYFLLLFSFSPHIYLPFFSSPPLSRHSLYTSSPTVHLHKSTIDPKYTDSRSPYVWVFIHLSMCCGSGSGGEGKGERGRWN